MKKELKRYKFKVGDLVVPKNRKTETPRKILRRERKEPMHERNGNCYYVSDKEYYTEEFITLYKKEKTSDVRTAIMKDKKKAEVKPPTIQMHIIDLDCDCDVEEKSDLLSISITLIVIGVCLFTGWEIGQYISSWILQ